MTITPPLTVAQAAAAMNTKPKHILTLIAEGELRAWRLGRQWRIDPSAIEQFKAEHMAAPKVVSVGQAVQRRRRAFGASLADHLPAARYFYGTPRGTCS